MLKRINVCTVEANNGKEAVNLVNEMLFKNDETEIVLIFMDLNMPIMDGVEATVEIRKLEKKYKRINEIPIIAVTAHETEKDSCFRAGMQDFTIKPISIKTLKHFIKQYAQVLYNKN